MLKFIKGSGVAAGKTAYACLVPSNQYYLSKVGTPGTKIQGRCFSTDAKEGIDFERITK